MADRRFRWDHRHKLGKAAPRLRVDPKAGAQGIGLTYMADPSRALAILVDVHAKAIGVEIAAIIVPVGAIEPPLHLCHFGKGLARQKRTTAIDQHLPDLGQALS